MIKSRGERLFAALNYILLGLFAILAMYPIWEVVRVSLSTATEASRMQFTLWPKVVSFEAYGQVFMNEYIWIGYKNTIIRVILGMAIQMTLMILGAYCLSKKSFPNRRFWTAIIVFTMFFSGGLIPQYLLVKSLHIDDTIWALVLPRAIDTFSMLILRNYFMTLPESMEESAKIDGASVIRILIFIILPLSMPILMTVLLWGIVWHWNAWFDCIIYIRDSNKYVLQAILRKIIIDAAPQFQETTSGASLSVVSPDIAKCATIIVSTIPILVVYPFIQKYFVQGVMVGAIKE